MITVCFSKLFNACNPVWFFKYSEDLCFLSAEFTILWHISKVYMGRNRRDFSSWMYTLKSNYKITVKFSLRLIHTYQSDHFSFVSFGLIDFYLLAKFLDLVHFVWLDQFLQYGMKFQIYVSTNLTQ